MIDLKIITPNEKNLFIRSLNTVTKQLSFDISKLALKQIDKNEFLEKYGHLRPGTYDILSESYAENPSKYFDFNNLKNTEIKSQGDFHFSSHQLGQIDALLRQHNLKTNVSEFIIFLKEAIEGREYGKFVFTKSVNEILKLVKKYGSQFGLSADDMSFCDITTLMRLYSTIAFVEEKSLLSQEIHRNKKINNAYKLLKLPTLICEADDIYRFYHSEIEPNFVTLNNVAGEPIFDLQKRTKPQVIFNKIVFIESADPGFDWIFSYNIAGLVTMYGGVNSHMAIRAAELNIPAVIGCGPVNFGLWSRSGKLEIDCLNKKVIILS